MKYLVFKLDDSEFAVDVACVQSVVEYRGAADAPSRVSCFRGVVEVRENLIPLYDLRVKLGLSAGRPDAESRIVIVEARRLDEDCLLGALVDGVSGVYDLEEADDLPLSGASVFFSEDLIDGFSRAGDRIITRLALKAFIEGFDS